MMRALSPVATALLAIATVAALVWVLVGGVSGYIERLVDAGANARSQPSNSVSSN